MDMVASPSARAVKRIEDVRSLRQIQFPEDAGPMAHPVRPDSYVEINYFYTPTVYEKGAEVVRMMQTLVGRAGCAIGPASSGNCTWRSDRTSWMRLTARADALASMSMLNSWSRKTVRPSFRLSWNQSRQVMRLPVQLWKYSWPTTDSIAAKSASVAVAAVARTYFVLKMFRPLFSIAPMLKLSLIH